MTIGILVAINDHMTTYVSQEQRFRFYAEIRTFLKRPAICGKEQDPRYKRYKCEHVHGLTLSGRILKYSAVDTRVVDDKS